MQSRSPDRLEATFSEKGLLNYSAELHGDIIIFKGKEPQELSPNEVREMNDLVTNLKTLNRDLKYPNPKGIHSASVWKFEVTKPPSLTLSIEASVANGNIPTEAGRIRQFMLHARLKLLGTIRQ